MTQQATKQPYMMGEGLGYTLGLEHNKKYCAGMTPSQIATKEAGEAEYREELKKKRAGKTVRERYYRVVKTRILKTHKDSQGLLVGQRIFFVRWNYSQWEERAKVFGGIPEGLDVALTEFGHLLLVPVMEMEEAIELGIAQIKVEPRAKRIDTNGRRFFIRAEIKDFCTKVFGCVDWRRPLSIQEVTEQFKVNLE